MKAPRAVLKPVQNAQLFDRNVNMSNALTRVSHGLDLAEKRLIASCIAKNDSIAMGEIHRKGASMVRLSAAEYAETFENRPCRFSRCARGKLAIGSSVYDPADPMGKMFFDILATFAEFHSDLIRLRTREGWPSRGPKGGCEASGRGFPLSSRRNYVECTTAASIRSAIWPSCLRCRVRPSIEPSRASQRRCNARRRSL